MGHAHSQDAFATVLPADKATQSKSTNLPTKSASSGASAVGTPNTNVPEPKSLTGNGGRGATDSTSGPKELPTMRIQPSAHALQLQDDSWRSSARSSSGGDNDGALIHREGTRNSDASTTDSRFLVPESVRKSRVLDEFAGVCSEILPGFLFVGNLQVARNAQRLKELGITHIVNCCKELGPYLPTADLSGIKVLSLALRDDTKEDLLWFFYHVIEFIQSAEAAEFDSPPHKVLVHCHQGISRSCAFVVAYVMYERQQQQSLTNFRDALAFVKAKRPIASPNTAFLCQLIEWERELAMFSSGSSQNSTATGLYRLAPHAAHDPDTLVLKCCYEPGSQREKLVAEDGSYSFWLYTRGVFVFMRPSTSSASQSREIVIWRGRECEIPDGVAMAKALVEQMACVRLGQRRAEGQNREWAHLGIEIVEAREEDQEIDAVVGGGGSLIDHFGHTEELNWLKISSSAISTVDPNNSGVVFSSSKMTNAPNLQPVATEVAAGATITVDSIPTNSLPLLFILEDVNEAEEGVWDQLTEYDSEDLTPGDAFLLVQPFKGLHFLWIGPDHTAFTPDTLLKCAQTHVRALLCGEGCSSTNGGSGIAIKSEKGREESDEFWTAFESGY